MALARSFQGFFQIIEFARAPHKAREPARRRRLKACPARGRAFELIDLYGLGHPLDGHRSERLDLNETLTETKRLRR